MARLAALQNPLFRLWAVVRVAELAKRGESARIVVWLRNRVLELEDLDDWEPEIAVQHASGRIERSPNAVREPLQLVRRTAPAPAPKRRASSTR